MVVVLCWTGCAVGGRVGQERPDARLLEAQSDFDAATKLKDAGNYSEALARAEHALALREAVLGSMHRDVASCLNLMGDLYRRQGDLARAEPLLLRALALREAALGNSHPDVASSLNNLAILYKTQGLYDRAEPLYLRALAIYEAALGNSHPNVADSLHNLAALYYVQGLYGRAEPLLLRSLALREAALGNSHSKVAASLNSLAVLYMDRGLYGRAEPLYLRALAIYEAALGNSHPYVADSLHNLANLYMDQGLYGRAEPLLQRALAIYEAALGNSHPTVADSLNNLATLYSAQGLYNQAEPLYLRALSLQEAALGNSHPAVADSLNNLAVLYRNQGLYGRAEPLLQRGLAIYEAALGPSHPNVAFSLNNLATLYKAQGLYGRAEPLLQRALTIKEAALGNSHPNVASSLHNLANLYMDQGLYGRAEPLLQRGLAIYEAALGPSHPDVADSLGNLASLYLIQGLYGRAEPLYLRALSLQEAALGPSHPDVASSLHNLAVLRLAQHRLDDALPLFTRAFSLFEQRLRHEALDFSESRLSSFLRYLRDAEEKNYALLRAYPQDARVQHLALSTALLLKGRSVEETAHISRTVYQSLGPEDRVAFERLRALRTHLASMSFSGPGAPSPEDYQQRLKALADEGDALEADLAQRSARLRSHSSLPSPSDIVERVAASLPQDGALVEFVAYSDTPLVPQPGTPVAATPAPLRYLALVLFPDGSTRAVDLGSAALIDSAASRLRDALAHKHASFEAIAQRLHRLAFQPLLPLLGKTRRLLLSTDGQLSLVPFAALHDGKDFLLNSYDFTYLTSGRQFLPRPQDNPPTSSIIVLADPDFSASVSAPPSSSSPSSSRAPSSDALARFFSRSGLPTSSWVPLPGTRQEALDIQRLLPQAQLFLGPEATKQRLFQLPTPSILHVATHGFFLGDVPASRNSRAVGLFGESMSNAPPPQQDPLLNSGLVLAGARSTASSSSAPRPDFSLVTALELAGLNLWGTQLVVLSACDTGRGEVRLGQGIQGLRRALVVAGAESVVMSLWKVNDNSTRLLMDAYYRHLLAGQGRASALREAMRSLRASPLHHHPYHWAPFIALGSDAPLHGISPSTR
nr:CHAT domain-containing tetratricopeptide repeat protein [Cystobacter fuscus]